LSAKGFSRAGEIARFIESSGPGGTVVAFTHVDPFIRLNRALLWVVRAEERAVSRPNAKETDPRKKPRVVLALPDEDWARELAESLHRAGFVPHRAPSPDTASLAVLYRNPAAVFLDASFIATAGYRYFDSLRANAPDVPVIVLTDATDEHVRLKCLTLGAEDCLVRPFNAAEGVFRVRRAVQRQNTLRELADTKAEATNRSRQDRADMGILRNQMRKSVTLLQRAVDFHQRLTPDGNEATLQALFLRHLSVQTGVTRLAYLAPSHEGASWMSACASWGVPTRLTDRIRMPAGGELARMLQMTALPLVVDRLASFPGLRLELGIVSAGGFTACVPLLQKGELFAVLLLGEGRSGGAPDEETLRMCQFLGSALVPTLAAQSGWTAERHVSAETLGFLVNTLEARNPYLRGHSQCVAVLAEDIGKQLGMQGVELSRLTSAALLHDIGRFETDAALWMQTEPLDDEDWKMIRRHPEAGAAILEAASWPEEVVAAVRHHHEHWDGGGYPSGLRGQSIPWLARILAVADALEALRSPRPQRSALSEEEALETLSGDSGSRYDPHVVAVAGRLLESTPPPASVAS
jgi:putative nucleotidyltransferase with HDIG domain